MNTDHPEYTEHLKRKSSSLLKRLLNVQAPYRWNIRRVIEGVALDVGCGIGRYLKHLNGNGVGIDHNPASVRYCQEIGLIAFTPENFATSNYSTKGRYDTLLFAHVLEHMTPNEARDLVGKYLFYLRKNGRIVLICPQSRGFQSDSTHVHYFSAESLTELACDLGLRVESTRSFPFPKFLGRVFTHNETIVLARL
jgi:2-polyprenyl-3-methyl-5-hydroxy-6-metoxy-1,4-benzoquinol methylase